MYFVQVPDDAVPKAADDASSAEFYDLREIIKQKDKLAFDHSEILNELIDKKLKNYHI